MLVIDKSVGDVGYDADGSRALLKNFIPDSARVLFPFLLLQLLQQVTKLAHVNGPPFDSGIT